MTDSPWIYFDRSFCVNLDRRSDRWIEVKAELERCGIRGCERFSAFDRHGKYGGGINGCGASHRAIWRRIASGGYGDRVLIFEDDAMFTTREVLLRAGYATTQKEIEIFDSLPGKTAEQRLAALLPEVPSQWDLLYLGGGYETEPHSRPSPHIIRNRGMLTTHAYAITRAMAERMTKRLDAGHGVGTEIDPDVFSGAPDQILADVAKDPNILSYTVTPRLFIQRPTTVSDLNPIPPGGFPWDQTDSRHELMV